MAAGAPAPGPCSSGRGCSLQPRLQPRKVAPGCRARPQQLSSPQACRRRRTALLPPAAAAAVDDAAAAPTVDSNPPSTARNDDDRPSTSAPVTFDYDAPAWVRERNAAFAERIKGKLILAPLTKGGNLPFRRLCTQYGAEVTYSEMSFSKPLLKGVVGAVGWRGAFERGREGG